MRNRTAVCSLTLVFVAMFSAGLLANHRWQSWKYADSTIRWYNGGTGDYYNIYQEEAITDADAWDPFTVINFDQVGSYGTDDQINAFNGYYGQTGWLGLAEIQGWSGWTIHYGQVRLNETILEVNSRTVKEHVACQEVGHMFGLDHNRDQTDTCMNDVAGLATSPNAHDAELLEEIYGGGGPSGGESYIMVAGESLFPGDSAASNDGRFWLMYQGDGNLVLYRWDWVALWSSGTAGSSAGRVDMQSDGNFVVYNSGGGAVWHAGTYGNSGAYLVVQDDGNTVIYAAGGSPPLWYTGTCCY